MKKGKMAKYLAVTFASAWLLQAVVISDYLTHKNMQSPVFIILMAVVMFTPLLGTLAVNGTLRGLGWIPSFKNGKIKIWLLAWLLPAVTSALGAILYFVLTPDHISTTAYLQQQSETAGIDLNELLASNGLTTESYLLIPAIASFPAAFFNMIAAVGEETGWRGFLYPELKERFGRTKGLLAGGLIWGVWHFPVIIFTGYNYSTDCIGAPFAPPLVFCIGTIAFGIIADYVYEKTESIWAPALFHGAINAFANYALILSDPKYSEYILFGPKAFGLISLIPVVVIAAIILKKKVD